MLFVGEIVNPVLSRVALPAVLVDRGHAADELFLDRISEINLLLRSSQLVEKIVLVWIIGKVWIVRIARFVHTRIRVYRSAAGSSVGLTPSRNVSVSVSTKISVENNRV